MLAGSAYRSESVWIGTNVSERSCQNDVRIDVRVGTTCRNDVRIDVRIGTISRNDAPESHLISTEMDVTCSLYDRNWHRVRQIECTYVRCSVNDDMEE